MPEEEKDTTGADDAGTGAGDGADQDQGKGEAGDQNTEEKKDGGDADDAGEEGDKNPDEKKEESQKGEDGEPEIKTRKSPKDFIIERQARKIAKLQDKSGEDDDEDDDSDKEVLPEDKKAIRKVAMDAVAPILQRQLDAENEQEIGTFIAENSEFKPYATKVRKLMAHPSRAQVPIESLFYEAAGPDLMKLGALKKKEADNEANQSNAGGGSSRETAGKKTDWAAMPNENFAQELQKIKTAPRED